MGNFNRLIDDLVCNNKRNLILFNVLISSFDVQFILITGHHKQVEILDKMLFDHHGETFYTITHEDVEDLIHSDSSSNLKKYQTRLLAISFVAFDKLSKHFISQPIGTSNILDGVGGIIIGTPHKNIDGIIEYAYQYHNGHSKHRRHLAPMMGTDFKYHGHDSCSLYDVCDNHDLLEMWAKWHEDKFFRLKLMDPNPPAHHEENKDTSNLIAPTVHKVTHSDLHQRYRGVLTNLNTGASLEASSVSFGSFTTPSSTSPTPFNPESKNVGEPTDVGHGRRPSHTPPPDAPSSQQGTRRSSHSPTPGSTGHHRSHSPAPDKQHPSVRRGSHPK